MLKETLNFSRPNIFHKKIETRGLISQSSKDVAFVNDATEGGSREDYVIKRIKLHRWPLGDEATPEENFNKLSKDYELIYKNARRHRIPHLIPETNYFTSYDSNGVTQIYELQERVEIYLVLDSSHFLSNARGNIRYIRDETGKIYDTDEFYSEMYIHPFFNGFLERNKENRKRVVENLADTANEFMNNFSLEAISRIIDQMPKFIRLVNKFIKDGKLLDLKSEAGNLVLTREGNLKLLDWEFINIKLDGIIYQTPQFEMLQSHLKYMSELVKILKKNLQSQHT